MFACGNINEIAGGSSTMKILFLTAAVGLAIASSAAQAGVHKSTVPPKGNPARWVAEEDADTSILQRGGGTATVAYDITPEGRVANCRVTKPAESPKIGKFICSTVTRRGRYAPGTAGTGTYTMGWNY